MLCTAAEERRAGVRCGQWRAVYLTSCRKDCRPPSVAIDFTSTAIERRRPQREQRLRGKSMMWSRCSTGVEGRFQEAS